MRYRGVLTGALLAAALVPGMPAEAHGCGGTKLVPTARSGARAAKVAVCLVNRTRRRHGLAPVRRNAKLRAAAHAHSADMIARGYFSHDSPDGQSVLDRVRATGYFAAASTWRVGETIAVGSGTRASPRAIVSAWMHSPGHRAILLDPGFKEIGMGVAGDGGSGPGAMYTADFGRR